MATQQTFNYVFNPRIYILLEAHGGEGARTGMQLRSKHGEGRVSAPCRRELEGK
jgi:hypothetical protein